MLRLSRLAAFLVVSAVVAYFLNHFGFAVVHSAAALLMTVVLAPGFFLAFFHVLPSEAITWVAVVAVNAIYYELVVRLVTWWRARERVNRGA